MDRLEVKRQRLLKSLNQAVDLILGNGDVKYIVCVRLRDEETQKLITGILHNLSYETMNGSQEPATPGMLMDVILEALLDDKPIPKFPEPTKNPHIN